MNGFLARLHKNLHKAWKARSPREQRALQFVAVAMAAAIWVQFLWFASEQTQLLRHQIAKLESRKALVRTLATQMANTDENGKAVPRDSAHLPELTGLSIQTSGNRFQISGTVAFDAWLAWVAEAQRDSRIVLTSARLRKAALPGHVLVDAEMEHSP